MQLTIGTLLDICCICPVFSASVAGGSYGTDVSASSIAGRSCTEAVEICAYACSCRCSTQIILRNEAQLQPYIQKLLTNLMDGNKTESAFEDDFAELLPQVMQ